MSEAIPDTPVDEAPVQEPERSSLSDAKPAKEVQSTDYLILTNVMPDEGEWKEGGKISARGAMSAVRAYAEKNGEGRYVAVPVRSWSPVMVGKVTQEKLTFQP